MRPPFVRSQFAADLSAATALRSDLDQWLYEALGLPAAIRYDVVLAAYEAMANVALHAYRDVAPPRTMGVEVRYDATTGVLAVTVTDHGRWREQDTTDSGHGRGITLMRGLADRLSVNTSLNGTRAEMTWTSCPIQPERSSTLLDDTAGK